MELKINNKYQEVNFWSFMKCSILVQLAFAGMIYGTLFIFGIILAIFS